MSEPAVRAAGGVLWRRVDGRVEVALVHRPKYDDWSLPKGKLEAGELAVAGALREVEEETGFRAVPGPTLGSSRYRVLHQGRDVEKTVRWWAMRAATGEFVPGSEVDALRWATVGSALARVSGGYDCAPLRAFAELPPETTTVLLVRHASAGDRASWTGDDAERPLDRAGERQATALTRLLARYAPERVLSAPLVRCTQTVRPLAEQLGVEVEQAPAASEAENGSSPAALVGLLRKLAVEGRPVVVCSQGGAIPGAVRELGAGLGITDAPARKGSLWALSFSGDRLVDADHVDRAG